MTVTLECTHVSKAFDGHRAVDGLNLRAKRGQLLALLGPSGCGKTTTLRLIAGFEWPDSGTIAINGGVVADENARVPAEKRRVGMVFQEYALFPHVDVAGNIGFGLSAPARQKQARVAEMLELVGLENFTAQMPHELSGGQQQRIALARALAPQPEILLLDEPFSNLDAGLRMQMRAEVRAILRQAGITAIFVTHDQEEALSIADEVGVMFDGRLVQIDEPQRLYHHPASREVAAFVGEANFLRGEAAGDTVACVLGRLPLIEPARGAVDVLLRPEALQLTTNDNGDAPDAHVLWREFYGHDQRLGVALRDGTMLIVRADAGDVFSAGQGVRVRANAPVRVFPRTDSLSARLMQIKK